MPTREAGTHINKLGDGPTILSSAENVLENTVVHRIAFILVASAVTTACVEASPTETSTDDAVEVAPLTCEQADTSTDPLNCGVCGNVCASGLCYAGVCPDDRAGHIFAIGNSYRLSNPALDRVLGNALFLKEGKKLNAVIFRGTAPSDIVAGTSKAIVRTSLVMKRQVKMIVVANSAALQIALPTADVLVIEAQPQLADETLGSLANEWNLPIDDFTRRGGVVIVLDGPSTTNHGTVQVLGNLMPLVTGVAPGTIASINAVNDQAVGRVPLTFALASSVGYGPSGYIDAAISETGAIIVAHRTVQ